MTMIQEHELARFIQLTSESSRIDAKAAMKWDGAEQSAKLTKHILAFANSEGGGVLVIGKGEKGPGEFVNQGLTRQQSESFDTTKVATWVNNRCTPKVNLTCNRVEYEGKEYVVIVIEEFDDMPIMCVKNFDNPIPKKGKLLEKGRVYVRSEEAQSEPLSNPESLRVLVNIATRKNHDRIVRLVESVLRSKSILAESDSSELWKVEVSDAESQLDKLMEERALLGQWYMRFHPANMKSERWTTSDDLKDSIHQSLVSFHGIYPDIGSHDTRNFNWGFVIRNDYRRDFFAFGKSGLVICRRVFVEDYLPVKEVNPPIEAKRWFGFRQNIAMLCQFLEFLSKFAQVFDDAEDIYCQIEAAPLENRILYRDAPLFRSSSTEIICHESRFRFEQVMPVARLRSDWEGIASDVLVKLFELFPTSFVDHAGVVQFVDLYKQRKLY